MKTKDLIFQDSSLFLSCTGQFVSDQVENHEDRIARVVAQICSCDLL